MSYSGALIGGTIGLMTDQCRSFKKTKGEFCDERNERKDKTGGHDTARGST